MTPFSACPRNHHFRTAPRPLAWGLFSFAATSMSGIRLCLDLPRRQSVDLSNECDLRKGSIALKRHHHTAFRHELAAVAVSIEERLTQITQGVDRGALRGPEIARPGKTALLSAIILLFPTEGRSNFHPIGKGLAFSPSPFLALLPICYRDQGGGVGILYA